MQSQKHRIVFGSGNKNKYLELVRMLEPSGVQLLFGPDAAGCEIDVDETGVTYTENALLKARAWSAGTGLPSMADDSGLEVRALDWRPGICSSRVADGDNRCVEWLLGELSGENDREARFVGSLALVVPHSGAAWVSQGCCWGAITTEPQGADGFGYDPVFVPSGYSKTFATLGQEIKNGLSHRFLAARGMARMLIGSSVLECEVASNSDNFREVQ
ncbi:MAG: non-canonical purine NTP pyrophosphatase [Synergistota bacterium]|nr:non-canonical purine NTP pyrophosphatase [Synergistota bacterium]